MMVYRYTISIVSEINHGLESWFQFTDFWYKRKSLVYSRQTNMVKLWTGKGWVVGFWYECLKSFFVYFDFTISILPSSDDQNSKVKDK